MPFLLPFPFFGASPAKKVVTTEPPASLLAVRPELATDASPIIPLDMHPPVDLAEDYERFFTVVSAYLKPDDLALIEEAYRFAEIAHRGQLRYSGAPYLTHPLAVATTLAEWRLDTQALIAALLHDVIEDAAVLKADIAWRFGKVAAELVDGVSKLDRLEHQTYVEAQADNFRKMLLAMARDVRVMLIKLADRLHNMRTLSARRVEKRRLVARETLEIYAPIANRLGFDTIYRELQELAFQHLCPLRYRVLAKALRTARGNRRELVGKLFESIRTCLPQFHVEAEIIGREKHLYSIYHKMRVKRLSFSQVLDIYGFRIIVQDLPACYLALGALHSLYKPVPGKFKDYIAIPKANRYQSLHTTLIGPYGTPLEIQIRTREMNHVAESGIAAHWLYKDERDLSGAELTQHKWLQSLLDLQESAADSTEFLEHVKVDLYPDEVYVFTPGGNILELPRGATVVDFAYAVHTDIGNQCVACRINSEAMPLRSELKNGDRVEIITAPHAAPNAHWLTFVRTGKARSQIRHALKNRQITLSVALGERLLTQALRRLGLDLFSIANQVWERVLAGIGVKSVDAMLAEIGRGRRLPAVVAQQLAQNEAHVQQTSEVRSPLLIDGEEGEAVRLAHCCRPIPGDPIIALLRAEQGLVVHTVDCPALRNKRRVIQGETPDIRPDQISAKTQNHWIEVEWAPLTARKFEATLRVIASNRPGVLAKIAAAIAENHANIINIGMDEDTPSPLADAPALSAEKPVRIATSATTPTTTLFFTLHVADRVHLASIMKSLRRIHEVSRIYRHKEL